MESQEWSISRLGVSFVSYSALFSKLIGCISYYAGTVDSSIRFQEMVFIVRILHDV